jgi:hypothetical protein
LNCDCEFISEVSETAAVIKEDMSSFMDESEKQKMNKNKQGKRNRSV